MGQKIIAKTLENPISELVTVRDVPMVSTGIDYPTSTGLITFTETHLQDLVSSQDDPAIHPPRTKIGHADPRFNARVTPDGEVLDGEPSLGSWINLRLGDNGQTVYGDLVGVPRWFASIMSTAYPSRSIEGNFDVETVTGHKWSLSVDAVAMLGVVGPGVTTLDDLPILFSESGPEDVQVVEPKEGDPMSVIHGRKNTSAVFSLSNSQTVVAVSDTPWSNFKDSDYTDAQYASACVYDRGKCGGDWASKPAKERYSLPIKEPGGALNRNGVHAAAGRINQVSNGCDAALKAAKSALRSAYSTLGEEPPDSIESSSQTVASGVVAQANLDDVRRDYYSSLDQSQNWWWIRAIYFDPNELIVDDDEGGLYRVGFSTKGDSIKFSDPVPVKIQYVDQPATTKAASAKRAAVAASFGSPALTYDVRNQSRPGGCMTPEEAAALRERHGLTPEQLPDDADDAAALRVVIQASSTAAPTPPSGEESEETPANAPPETAITSTAEAGRIPQSQTINLPEGTIVVDKATWDEVANQARQGAELAARTRDTERDDFLNKAVLAGKFPPSRKEHYLNAWKADPEGTRGLIDSLAPGLVPVEARGTAGTGKDERVEGSTSDAYDENWLTPMERHRLKAAPAIQAGTDSTPMVVQGGD